MQGGVNRETVPSPSLASRRQAPCWTAGERCPPAPTLPATLRTQEEEAGPRSQAPCTGPQGNQYEGLPCSPEAMAYFLHGRPQLYPDTGRGSRPKASRCERKGRGWGEAGEEQAALAGESGKWGHLGGCPVQDSRRPLIAQVLSSPQNTLRSPAAAAGALCQHKSTWCQFPSSHNTLDSNHDTHQPW